MERISEAGFRGERSRPGRSLLLVCMAAGGTAIGYCLWHLDQPTSALEPGRSGPETEELPRFLDSDVLESNSEVVITPTPREDQTNEAQIAASSVTLEPSDEKRFDYFVEDLARRISVLSGKNAEFVLSRLPPEFCQMYLAECAQLSAAPDALLGDIVAPPGTMAIRDLLAREDRRRVILENRKLADLFAQVRGFATAELKASRGETPHTSIDQHIAGFSALLEGFRSGSEVRAAAGEYGQAVLEESAGVGEPTLDAKELKLTALLWEERCRKENQMIGTLPRETRFWLHVTRVMTRYVYDDSYWLAPDELSAAEERYPDHLQTR